MRISKKKSIRKKIIFLIKKNFFTFFVSYNLLIIIIILLIGYPYLKIFYQKNSTKINENFETITTKILSPFNSFNSNGKLYLEVNYEDYLKLLNVQKKAKQNAGILLDKYQKKK